MKWILITMLFLSAQAEATLIQYSFEVLTRERTGSPGGATDLADMTLLVDADSRQITKLRYTTQFFDIDFQGEAGITAQFRWFNQDGSGYYGINSFMEGAMPDGTSINMFLEATMPLNGNPAHFLNNGTDGQHFIFSTENLPNTYIGEWMRGEKIIVPEPATLSLLGLGLGVIGLRRYSRRAKKR